MWDGYLEAGYLGDGGVLEGGLHKIKKNRVAGMATRFLFKLANRLVHIWCRCVFIG